MKYLFMILFAIISFIVMSHKDKQPVKGMDAKTSPPLDNADDVAVNIVSEYVAQPDNKPVSVAPNGVIAVNAETVAAQVAKTTGVITNNDQLLLMQQYINTFPPDQKPVTVTPKPTTDFNISPDNKFIIINGMVYPA